MSSQDSILHDILEGDSFDLDTSDILTNVAPPPRARSPVPLERINLVLLPAIELRQKLTPLMTRFRKISELLARIAAAGIPSTPAISDEQQLIRKQQREYDFLKVGLVDLLQTHLPSATFSEDNAPTVLAHAMEVLVESKIQDIVLIDRKLLSGYEEIEKVANKPNAYGDYVSKLMAYTRAIRSIALEDSVELEEEYYYRGALYDQELKLLDGTQPVASSAEKENLIVEITRLNEENAKFEEELNAAKDSTTRLAILNFYAKKIEYPDLIKRFTCEVWDDEAYWRYIEMGLEVKVYPKKFVTIKAKDIGGGQREKEEYEEARRQQYGVGSTFVEFPPRSEHSFEILMEWEHKLQELVNKNKETVFEMIIEKFIHQYMLDKENEKLENERQEQIRYEKEYPEMIQKIEDINKKMLWMKEDIVQQRLISRKEGEICDMAGRYARKLSLYWTSIEKTYHNMRRDFEYQIGLKQHRNIRTSYNEVYVDPDHGLYPDHEPAASSPPRQPTTASNLQPTPTLPQELSPAASREALLNWLDHGLYPDFKPAASSSPRQSTTASNLQSTPILRQQSTTASNLQSTPTLPQQSTVATPREALLKYMFRL